MTKEEIQYEAQSIIQEWGSNDSAPYVEFVEKLASMELPESSSNLDEAAEEYAYNNWEDNDYHTGASEGLPFDAIGHTEKCFKAGAEWQREQYGCIPAEEAYMRGFAQGAKEERKDLAPLINRLCEAILFEWKDAADLARKTLIQIKEMEE